MDTQPLTVAIAMLTYNRQRMMRATLASLDHAGGSFWFDIVDNGSTDGSADTVLDMDGYCNATDNHTTGFGMNLAIGLALARNPDIVLFTADDYAYQPEFLQRLVSFWNAASDQIVLASCHMENVWSWNTIRGKAIVGGVPCLIRDSLPGSNWSFRARDWGLIGPISEQTGGEDLAICKRLTGQGKLLAALNLVDHIGEETSAWGNQSWRYAKPLSPDVIGWMSK
jgi:glycosyltransferase involved in cell wall biosynthesis